jgi:hypothetical protein
MINLHTTNRWKLDGIRVALLILGLVLCFAPDVSALLIVKYVFGFLFSQALVSHVIRRVLFPTADMRDYLVKAKEDPIASAIVFLGMVLIICVSFVTGAFFFK